MLKRTSNHMFQLTRKIRTASYDKDCTLCTYSRCLVNCFFLSSFFIIVACNVLWFIMTPRSYVSLKNNDVDKHCASSVRHVDFRKQCHDRGFIQQLKCSCQVTMLMASDFLFDQYKWRKQIILTSSGKNKTSSVSRFSWKVTENKLSCSLCVTLDITERIISNNTLTTVSNFLDFLLYRLIS